MPPSVQRFTIGRDPSCTIPIAHDSISRQHAVIALMGQEISLEDTGSSNGTFLIRAGQKQRISKAVLTLDDKIQFGEVELSVGELLANHLPPATPVVNANAKLIRCSCGLVRPAHEKCAGCGQ